ncbi:IQ domain-containing protein C isoform X5 [Ciconia boyciana]|uniref:IQ domain-containing protein C isoform X5 n=1 Tax=Ciconia boyciana TaxID=52775 RepID=UPI003B9DEA44
MAAALGPQAEAEGWRRLLRAVTRLQKPMQGKCRGPWEAVPSDEASAEKPQEELDASEPDRDWVCSSVKPTAQLQSEKELSSAGEGGGVSSPNLDKRTEKGCGAPAESEDWQNGSSVSSVWDSAVPEAESLEACLEIPLEDIKELPRTRSGLQSYRNHLIMELLWLQQAIVSRKNGRCYVGDRPVCAMQWYIPRHRLA